MCTDCSFKYWLACASALAQEIIGAAFALRNLHGSGAVVPSTVPLLRQLVGSPSASHVRRT
eukprot:15451718-Alexandrium_andersonii.AAC.1